MPDPQLPVQILHLEDNPRDAEIVRDQLEADGLVCEITWVETPKRFEAALAGPATFDVILCDYNLPNYDGLAALKLAKARRSAAPVIMVSGSLSPEEAITSLKLGATDYLFKQQLERLVPALQRAIAEAREHYERQQAEAALRESEARLRAIFDNEPECVKLVGRDGLLLEINPAGLRMIEADSLAQVQNQSVYSLIAAEHRAAFCALHEKVLRGESGTLEFDIIGLKGARRTLDTHASPLRDATGAIIASLGLTRDITERKRSLARIHEQAEVINKAPVAIVVTDLSHRVTYCNEGAQRLYGLAEAELVGHTADELFSPETMRHLGAGREAALATGAWRGEVPMHTRDGRRIIVEFFMNLIRDATGRPKGRLSIGIDITEKKQLQEQFFRAQRMENLGLLAAGIAHDFNNILAPALMIAPLLRTRTKDPADLRLLVTLEQSAERGAALVRQILSFAHGTGGERLMLQPKHLARELASMIEETFPRAIQFETDFEPEPWPIHANPTQIHQVLLNLCVNARDAMPAGGALRLAIHNCLLDAEAAAAIPDARPGAFTVFEVADTGTGIPPEVLAHIWEPFFTTKGPNRGTGLGLSTVRGIITSHDGFTAVQTAIGVGTAFRIYLPAAETGTDSRPATSAPFTIRGRGELVLVVDDEAAVRDLVSATLTSYGYRVLLASDGVEAVAFYTARKAEIKVVVTDVHMPNLGGEALVPLLRRLNPAVRLLIISGLSSNDGQPDSESSAGGDTFLLKPFKADALLAAVHGLLHDPTEPAGTVRTPVFSESHPPAA